LPDSNRHSPNIPKHLEPLSRALPSGSDQLAVNMSPSEAAIIVARFLKANSYDEV